MAGVPDEDKFQFPSLPQTKLEHLYYSAGYTKYRDRTSDAAEASRVCYEYLQCATSFYAQAKPADYMWNDNFQMISHQPVRHWQNWTTWEVVEEFVAEFALAVTPTAERIYVGFTYGEPCTVTRDGCVYHVWNCYDEAKKFMQGFQRISQALFEHGIDTLCCPLTILLTVQGIFMTVTALVPIENLAPIQYKGTGTLLAHLITRLHRMLFLPPKADDFKVYRGMDGRWYIVDFTPMLVEHEVLRCRITVPLLRGHYLSGEDKSLEEYVDEDVAMDVVRTLVETIEVQMKITKDIDVYKLLEMDVMSKALNHHGANTRLLYRILVCVDEYMEKVQQNPTMTRWRRKPPKVAPKQTFAQAVAKGQLNVKVTPAEEIEVEEEQPNVAAIKNESDSDFVDKNVVSDGDDESSATPKADLNEFVAFQSGSDLHLKPPPQKVKRKPKAKQSLAAFVAFQSFTRSPKSDAVTPQTDPLSETTETEVLSDATPTPTAHKKVKFQVSSAQHNDDSTSDVERRRASSIETEQPGQPFVPVGKGIKLNAKLGFLTGGAVVSDDQLLNKKEEVDDSTAEDASASDSSGRRKLSAKQIAQLRKKSALLRAKQEEKRKMQQLKVKPKKSKTKKQELGEEPEVKSVLVPQKSENVSKSELLAPLVNPKALKIAKHIVVTELGIRAVKAMMRAEILDPANNRERFFQQLAESRIDLINRLCHWLYHPREESFWQDVSDVIRRKFGAPPSFEFPDAFAQTRFIIRVAPRSIGAAFNKFIGRFDRMLSSYKESSAIQPPQIVTMVLKDHLLNQATVLIAEEYEKVQLVHSPGSITKQCILQRLAFLGMLIMIKLSQNILNDLVAELKQSQTEDPFSPILANAMLVQLYTLSGSKGMVATSVEEQQHALAHLGSEADTPFQAEVERRGGILIEKIGLKSEAADLLMASVRSAERMANQAVFRPEMTRVQLDRLLIAALFSFEAEKEKNAEYVLHAAMQLADELPPVKQSRDDVSQCMLQMPTKTSTLEGMQTLKRIAEASVAFHEKKYGKFAPESCAARNVLASIIFEMEEDVTQELHSDLLLGLQVLEGNGEPIMPKPESPKPSPHPEPLMPVIEEMEKEKNRLEEEQKPIDERAAEKVEISPSSAPLSDTSAASKKKVMFQPIEPSTKPLQTSPPAAPLSTAIPTLASLYKNKKKTPSKKIAPLEQQRQQQLEATKKKTEYLSAAVRRALAHRDECERLWKYFYGSLYSVSLSELEEREEICRRQEEEQRIFLMTTEQAAARRLVYVMENYFSHYATWAEHAEIIEIIELEERHKGWLWEQSNRKRIAVREEYIHRTVLWNVQLITAASHLVVRGEFLNRRVLLQLEKDRRGQQMKEAYLSNLRQWEREEKVFREKWVKGVEGAARRQLHHLEERRRRNMLMSEEEHERDKLVRFMNFVGLEFALRAIEFWENSARRRVFDSYKEGHRQIRMCQEEDRRCAHQLRELVLRNEIERNFMEWQRCFCAVFSFVEEEELIFRFQIVQIMAEHTVFASEVHEEYFRAAVEHLEISEFEEMKIRHKKERFAALHTPAMRSLELAEGRMRRAIGSERTSFLIEKYELHWPYSRSALVAREHDERMDLVLKLKNNLHIVFTREKAELERLEQLFRQMEFDNEKYEAQRFVVTAEANGRRIVRSAWMHDYVELAEREEEACRLFLYRQQREEWAQDLFVGVFPQLIHEYALLRELGSFREVHSFVQHEIWDRVNIIDEALGTVTYLLTTCFEETIRDEIIGEWATTTGGIAAWFQAYITASEKLNFYEEREYQQRQVIECLETADWCFELEPIARETIVFVHEKVSLQQSFKVLDVEFGELLNEATEHLQQYEVGLRRQIIREESARWKELLPPLEAEKAVIGYTYRVRAEVQLEWFGELETIRRWSLQHTMWDAHRQLLVGLRIEKNNGKEQNAIILQSTHQAEMLIVTEHIACRALIMKEGLQKMEYLHRQQWGHIEKCAHLRLQAWYKHETSCVQRVVFEKKILLIAEEEHRAMVASQQCKFVSELLLNYEASTRLLHASQLFFEHAVAEKSLLEMEEKNTFLLISPQLLQKAEIIARAVLENDEHRSLTNLEIQFLESSANTMQSLCSRMEMREALRRSVVQEELWADYELLMRNLIVNEYYATFFDSLESNRAVRRQLLESICQHELKAVVRSFQTEALILLEEATARQRTFVQECDGFRDIFMCVRGDLFRIGFHILHYFGSVKLAAEANEGKAFLAIQCAVGAKKIEQRQFHIFQFEFVESSMRQRVEMQRCRFEKEAYLVSARVFLLAMALKTTFFFEEPYWRQVHTKAFSRRLLQIHQEESIGQEYVFRNLLLRRRRSWERERLWILQKIGRLVIQTQEAMSAALLVAWKLAISEHLQREKIQRRAVATVEVYWRTVTLRAAEHCRRLMIEQEHTLDPMHVLAWEFFLRARILVDECNIRAGSWAHFCCMTEWTFRRRNMVRERNEHLLDIAQAEEDAHRRAIERNYKREQPEILFTAGFQQIVVPLRENIEGKERKLRNTLLLLYQVEPSEKKQRKALIEESLVAFDKILRMEVAWRSCVREWESGLHARVKFGGEEPPLTYERRHTGGLRVAAAARELRSANITEASRSPAVRSAKSAVILPSLARQTSVQLQRSSMREGVEDSDAGRMRSASDAEMTLVVRTGDNQLARLANDIRREWQRKKPPHHLPNMNRKK